MKYAKCPGLDSLRLKDRGQYIKNKIDVKNHNAMPMGNDHLMVPDRLLVPKWYTCNHIFSCEVIRDHITQESLQYAFIEFDNVSSFLFHL